MTNTTQPSAPLDPMTFDYGSTPYDVIYMFLTEDDDDIVHAESDGQHNAQAILNRLTAAGFSIVPTPAADAVCVSREDAEWIAEILDKVAANGSWAGRDKEGECGCMSQRLRHALEQS